MAEIGTKIGTYEAVYAADDGIAVVTTNARGSVDSAFERRFDACIEFQPPAPPERAAIWRQELGEAGSALPRDAPALTAVPHVRRASPP